jgi:Rad3-related DNA helicase
MPLRLPAPEEAVKHFRLPSFRPGQAEALLDAAKGLAEGRNVQVEAPVGSGKSPMAVALASWAGGALITTPLNSLVDQYEMDFGRQKGVAVIKGRDNYDCEKTGRTAATAPCLYNSQARKACACPYSKARGRAEDAPIVVTNMALAMTAGWLAIKPLVIVDEAHNLETAVASQSAVELRSEEIAIPAPKATFQDYVSWLEKTQADARRQAEAVDEELEVLAEGGDFSWVPPDKVRERERWRSLALKITEMLLDYKQHGEPWIVQESPGWRGTRRLVFRPVTGTRFVRTKLLSRGSLAVLLTATPPTGSEVGLQDQDKRITLPMRWPKERRPVVLDFRGSMSFQDRERSLPRIAQGIQEHVQGKTLVHAHAYSIAQALSRELSALGVRHILQDPEEREGSLKAWLKGSEEVFLSVRMNEGLDLRDEMCRTQVLAKVPWPDIKDPWVKARNELQGESWMHREVARSIAQAYGRAIRSEKDWANFVVLDQGFESFYRYNKDLFPAWFREAVGLREVVVRLG